MFLIDIRFFEALETLISLALVKRNKQTRTLSLHRLVQTQFRYYLKLEDRQRAFENATLLVWAAFPSLPLGGQLYQYWEQCRLYLQHILALKDNYKRESVGPNSLKPIREFCKLLSNCARFLIETANYEELVEVVEVATSAFAKLEPGQQEPALLAAISTQAGVSCGHRGDFANGERYLMQAHGSYTKQDPPEFFLLSWNQTNIGNALASLSRYQESLGWHLRAQVSRGRAETGDSSGKRNAEAVGKQNLGRGFWLLGRYSEARDALDNAIKLSSENQAMLSLYVLGWSPCMAELLIV
jgi:tetratricopeptide (TPR) repeat protein